ncbi:hypothetical protein N7448_007414 [Penicillium atrosanguineum]|nr:uncharacterized protein N7443_001559 [Penicillium atrosanguineum]KAJ5126635.1 hypothetical protein N7448_007414 [Penicillium atrosanguineum]KAJ5146840.1 hypothetical protein N7526_000192 [Penicillium atrosanguineum]KAJ5314675.1 hypothetical protein N7443_001559 [Penicillium atrosanguineum]
MSNKPIFVATHPRACSTAFERVFMTQRATIQCIHEPFGDAFYYGPERLSERFEDDEQARVESGFSQSTYLTVLERIQREASEGKRVFIKDIDHYLLPPNYKPASVAPSLRRIKRGVGTNGDEHPANGVNGASNGTAHTNGHAATNGVNGTNGAANGSANGVNGVNGVNGHTNGTANGHAVNGTNGVHKPYPYNTPAEPGNPTVMPREIQEQFHFAFLIRDPHFSVPSYYRCTIPPLDKVTGFYSYDPSEAGYDELRRHFDYLRREGLVGPRVANRPDLNQGDECKTKDTVHEICVIDADDMLDNPAPTIEAFCHSVGLPYSPDLLKWDTPEDYDFACFCFEKWRGFHNDAIESSGLVARTHKKPVKTEEEYDAEWTKKYGPKGAALIRQAVDANMADYLYLKQFAVKV